jgi:hypothetical protein
MSKVGSFGQLEQEIERLKAEIELRDHRIKLLTEERDAERKLVAEMRDHVENANERIEDGQNLIQSWVEAFEMTLGDDGKWEWPEFVRTHNDAVDRYNKLLRKWNQNVADFNAVHESKARPHGRPLLASPAQCDRVRKLRYEGRSYRDIVDDTGLSMRTIRTIIARGTGADRTIRRHAELQKITIDRAEQTRWRARRRTRDRIPSQLNHWLKATEESVKTGRDLLKR